LGAFKERHWAHPGEKIANPQKSLGT